MISVKASKDDGMISEKLKSSDCQSNLALNFLNASNLLAVVVCIEYEAARASFALSLFRTRSGTNFRIK